jgi:hypothetical protein
MTSLSEQNLKYTLSTQAIERIIPSKDAVRLCEHMSQGKLTANMAVELIKKKYGVSERL